MIERTSAPPTDDRAARPAVAPSPSPTTYVLPTALLLAGAMLLLISIFLPYWELTLHAPQYPGGLRVELFVNRLSGEVSEIDGLNHYIGMARLNEAARLERSFAVAAVTALALLVGAAVFIQNRWAALLALPAVVYPVVFLADLWFWLYRFGHNLDQRAPLSSSVKPFTPMILGEGRVGQFRTFATVEEGFFLALAGAVAVVVGLYFHRRAYRPLVEARHRAETGQ